MALSVVDIEMGLPEDVYKDESCSKEELLARQLLGSPFSQASTAPCTPIRFFLPDPFDVPLPQPTSSFVVSEPPLCISMLPCWLEDKQSGKPDIASAQPKAKKRKVWVTKALPDRMSKPLRVSKPLRMSKPLLSIGESPWWVQYRQGWKESIPRVLRFDQPSRVFFTSNRILAKSQLAIVWSPKVVVAKPQPRLHAPRSQQEFAVLEFVDKHLYLVKKIKEHLPRNQQDFSVLEFVYKQLYTVEIKERLPRNQQDFAVLKFVTKREIPYKVDQARQRASAFMEFVTKREFKVAPVHVENLDIVDDAEWDIHEPTQDVDEDEWLQVDELYTPSVLEDICVLTANLDSAGMAGRAFTPDGRVIELNGGGPVAFSCEAQRSSGQARKLAAIIMAKTSSKARVAKAASDVDTETICSIDETGTVRGAAAMEATSTQSSWGYINWHIAWGYINKKDRLKLFHQKWIQGQVRTISSRPTQHLQALTVDTSGHVFLFNVKKPRRAARVQTSDTPRSVMTVDVIGVVRDIVEPSWDVRRGIDIDPDVLLIIDSNGVIRDHDDPFAGL